MQNTLRTYFFLYLCEASTIEIMKKFLIALLLLIAITITVFYAMGYGYVFTAVRVVYGSGHRTAFLSDFTYFDNRTIQRGKPQAWNIHKNYNEVASTEELDALHGKYHTTAFMIIKNDSVWHEQYFDDNSHKTLSNSFSMAKTYVSAMLGKAIMQGYIKSLNQRVGDFFPEFSTGLAADLTVGDLSSMASGSNWDESYYNAFSVTTQAYYDKDLRKIILEKVKIVEEPGQKYVYQSGNTQLLAMVLEKATGKKLTNYLSETFWQPLGCEYDAFWQIDSEEKGLEKAYCCIASNARDFARMGKLYLNYGKWNGNQLLDSSFVAKSIQPRFTESPEYGYGMWLLSRNGKNFFMMRGHLGQYVIMQPEDKIIIVRLGHLKGEDKLGDPFTDDIYGYIDQAYKMLQNAQ